MLSGTQNDRPISLDATSQGEFMHIGVIRNMTVPSNSLLPCVRCECDSCTSSRYISTPESCLSGQRSACVASTRSKHPATGALERVLARQKRVLANQMSVLASFVMVSAHCMHDVEGPDCPLGNHFVDSCYCLSLLPCVKTE